MAGIFGGNVSWIPGVDDFKVNYVLEGDEAANVFEGKVGDSSYVFLGERNGTEYITKSRTFEWGVNSIQPDGQIAAASNMQLPVRWGLNGQLLGITAGTVDWITPSDISNLSVSIAQFGCAGVTNNDLSGQSSGGNASPDIVTTTILENLQKHYTNFSYSDDETDFGTRTQWSGIAGDEIRLSTSLGLFSHAKAVSSMALGWQNTTSLPYSTLIGSNLDLSGHPYFSTQNDFSFGEVVIGTSNKKYEQRPSGSKQRILTIGCGDLSDNSGNDARDDAMYILKDGSTHFTQSINVEENVQFSKDVSLSGRIEQHGINNNNIFKSNIHIIDTDDNDNIKLNSNGTAEVKNLTSNKITTDTIEIKTPNSSLDFSGNTFANFKNFTEMRFYRGENYTNANTSITPTGISSEDISCSRISIGGLHFPPKINETRQPTIDHLGVETGETATTQNSKFVLTSMGDGTVMWRDLSSVAVDVSLHQLADVFSVDRAGEMSYLEIGFSGDTSGIKMNNLWISNGGDVSNALIEGSIDICKNVLIHGHLEVSGNTDICGNVDICGGVIIAGDVDISENVKIYGGVDISKNVIIGGHVDISENVIIRGGVDISKNVVIDGTADISGNVDISGDLQVNGRADISKNVIIGGNVDISGTTYLNDDVRIGTIAEPANLDVAGNVDISGTVKISNDIECSGNFFFSESATRRVQTLDFQDDRLSILGLIKTEVSTAIGQSIKTQAGGILWFARDKAPDNFRICNGQFFYSKHSPDLDNNLSSAIRKPWENGYNGMSKDQWESKYLKNHIIDISFVSSGNNSPPKFDINAMSAFTRHRLIGDISNVSSNQDISLTFFAPNTGFPPQNIDLKFNIKNPSSEDISINVVDVDDGIKEQGTNVKNGTMTFKMNDLGESLKFDISYGGESHKINFNVNNTTYSEFKNKYIQLPDLMDKFIRGSDGVDISIGSVKTEQLRDHKHSSTDHRHDLKTIVVDFSHNHDLSYDMHDMSVNHHDHSIAMGYVNYSSAVIDKNLKSHVQIDPDTQKVSAGKNSSDISLLIHPDSIIRHNLNDAPDIASTDYTVLSMTSRDQGGGELTIAGHTKTVEDTIDAVPSDTNIEGNYKFISISNDEFGYTSGKHEYTFPENTLTDASRSYVQGAYDASNQLVSESSSTRHDISSEGYPTHLTLLPCISIGVVQGVEAEGEFDYESYSYQNRIRYLENRLDKMDKQMNTTGINIIGGVDYIQNVTNAPSVWEVPTRGINYDEFNYSDLVFNITDISINYFFDFTEKTWSAERAGHNLVYKSNLSYDISGPTITSDDETLTTPPEAELDDTDLVITGTYKVIAVDTNVKIARYYYGKLESEYSVNDISWTFINPQK
jgi:predicted acyltransferase (DUF342 family)